MCACAARLARRVGRVTPFACVGRNPTFLLGRRPALVRGVMRLLQPPVPHTGYLLPVMNMELGARRPAAVRVHDTPIMVDLCSSKRYEGQAARYIRERPSASPGGTGLRSAREQQAHGTQQERRAASP